MHDYYITVKYSDLNEFFLTVYSFETTIFVWYTGLTNMQEEKQHLPSWN